MKNVFLNEYGPIFNYKSGDHFTWLMMMEFVTYVVVGWSWIKMCHISEEYEKKELMKSLYLLNKMEKPMNETLLSMHSLSKSDGSGTWGDKWLHVYLWCC